MQFSPENVPTKSDIVSSPLRNNFNTLQTILAGNLGDDNFGTANPLTIAKTELAVYTPWMDYTPNVVGATTAGTPSYTTRSGRYLRIGPLLFFTVRVTLSSHTGTGDLQCSLPVARSSNNSNVLFMGSIKADSLAYSSGVASLAIGIGAGNDYFEIYETLDNVLGQKVNIDGNASFIASGFYEI